jgi:hypothetical protein
MSGALRGKQILAHILHKKQLHNRKDGGFWMKKLLIFLAIVFAVSSPLAVFAEDHHGRSFTDRHDQSWQDRHDRDWRDHDREWRDHDREWREHRGDRRWREEHAREWSDWYQWHRDNESFFRIHISGDEFDLDIDG